MDFSSSDDIQEKETIQINDELRDNRAIVDNNKAQSLTGEDIDAMKRWEHIISLMHEALSSFRCSHEKNKKMTIFFLSFTIFSCRQGATGDEIVEALIANSATFDKKTSFSQARLFLFWISFMAGAWHPGSAHLKEVWCLIHLQEKYRLKKQKKYAPRVLVRRPFTRR